MNMMGTPGTCVFCVVCVFEKREKSVRERKQDVSQQIRVQNAAIPLSHLSDAPPQVSVAGRHDVALVCSYALADAVIRVRALVCARDAFKAGVLCVACSVSRQRAFSVN